MPARGGASLKSSVDGTIEIPVGGSAGFTWNADSPDGTKHAVAPVPMRLGTVSFTLGGAEPIAFAVYSDDDKSLDFYKRLDVPETGDTFEGKVVTEVYTGFETDTYTSRAEVPWADHKADIVKIKVVDRIRPVSMERWFDMADIDNPKLTEADLSEVDTGACKSMATLFQGAKSLNRIDGLRNWDTSKVSNLSHMFFRCSSMTSLDVSNWNTSKASDLSYLFRGCSSLQSLDVSGWNTSSCTDMRSIFSGCLSLESLDVSGWNTSKVTNFRFMFATSGNQYMKLRTVGDLSNWDTSNVTDMCAMFQDCRLLESIGDISGWNTAKVTAMNGLFNCCVRLGGIGDLSGWNTSNVTNMRYMFEDCEYLESIGDISNWNTSKVTNMDRLFNHCIRLNDIGNLSRWDTSSCTNMHEMFRDCLSLESLDLSGWNTSKVTTFAGMFATSGNQYMKLRTVGDLSDWDTSNVTDMCAMFQDCEYLENIGDISGWDTSKVANMSWLFNRCVRLNGIGDLSRWDTSNCNVFSSMFRGEGMTKTGMEIDVSFVKTWDVRSATDISGMFMCCTAQKELNLSGWDISSVKEMSSIFDGMTGLRKISLPASWKWIGSTGTAGYLPTPSASSIPGADGKWYSTTTGTGYAPSDIPTDKADTYVASKELLPKVAFAVYSADDQSLDFYKRFDVPKAGDTFEGKTVAVVYTGFETDTYASRAKVPWADHKADIVKIDVVDRIRPVSMALWFDMTDVDNPKLTEADLSEVDTGACESIFCLFKEAKSLRLIDGLQNWDTSSCTTMKAAFYNCSALQSIDVSNWNTSKASDLSYMFFRCGSLTSLDVSNWNTSSCTTMRSIFGECMSLESLDVSRWDTSKVTNFRFMFAGVRDQYMKLRTVGDLSDWDTSNVTDMSAMFQDCRLLESIGDISGWDTSNATTMKSMFYVCLSLESVDVSRWDTSKVTNFAFMFAGYGNQYMKLRTVGDLSNWNTSNATDMSAMFQDCEYLENIGDISGWDTSKVANMSWLFNRCVRLDGIGDLSRWDVSHCTGFDSMFRGDGMTKTGMNMDVSFVKAWDVRSATDIAAMFRCCTAQEELDLSGWDILSIKDMSSLFDGMTGLRKISLPASWKWIGSTGTAGYLPAPSSSNILGADGKWYSTTTGKGYAPTDIPTGKADTYVASK